MEVASLLQVNVAPGMGLPPESNAVPTSVAVAPRLTIIAFDPPPDVVTDTVAATCETVMPIDPLTPFDAALIAAVPLASDVTSPAPDTPATAVTLLDQAKVTLEVTSPWRGFDAVADSCTVSFSFENVVAPCAATMMVSTYTAVESTVIRPPPADVTVPTVATDDALAPSVALADTAARPSLPIVATVESVVVQVGAGAPATG